MAPLHLLVAAAFSFLSQHSSAAVAEPLVAVIPAPQVVEAAGPSTSPSASPSQASGSSRGAISREDASPLPSQIMRVLGMLQVVGVAEIDKSSRLVSKAGVTDTARLPVRAPVWLAPEPPTMPILYSRMMQLKF